MTENRVSFVKNLVGFSLVTLVSFAISFISAPITTRLFLPEQLGVINLFSVYSSMIVALSYLGLDQAYVRFYNEPLESCSKKHLLTFCTLISVVFSVMVGLFCMLFWERVSYEISGSSNLVIALCMAVFAVSSVIIRYLNLSYRMEKNIKWYTLQGIAHVFIIKLFYVISAFWYADATVAIIVLTVSNALFVVVFCIIQKGRYSFHLNDNISKPLVKDIMLFAVPLIPVTIISWLNSSLSNLVLRRMLGFSAIGIFSTAAALASCVNLVQAGFNTYWAPYVYENYNTEGGAARFWTVHRLITCVMVLVALAIILLQVPVFWLLGANYRGAALFFPFLLLSPVCYTIGETTGLGINIGKKTFWSPVALTVSIIVNLISCIILIPICGVTGAAMASSLTAIVYLIIRTYAGEKYYKVIQSKITIIKALFCLLSAAFVNYIFYDYMVIKYIILGSITALAVMFFYKEVKVLWKIGLGIILSILNKHNKSQ